MSIKQEVMKNTLKLTAVIALMLATTVSMAKEPKVSANGANKSILFEMEASAEPMWVRLVDAQDHIIYKDKADQYVGFVKRFDLNKLDTGIYYIEVESDIKQIVYTLSLKETGVEIANRKEKSKPIFRKKGDMVFLNLLNLDLESVEISVIDSEGRELFSENLKGEQIVQKAFNFKNAFSDSYTVVVRNTEGTYYEDIVVK